jgi:hypothetical protein
MRSGSLDDRDRKWLAPPSEPMLSSGIGRDDRRWLLATNESANRIRSSAGGAGALPGAADDPGVYDGEGDASGGQGDGEHARLAAGWVANGHTWVRGFDGVDDAARDRGRGS